VKIILIADRPGWAYDILAQSIKSKSKYQSIDVAYISDIRLNTSTFDVSNYDVVFFFLWYDAMRYGPKINGFEFTKTCVGIHSLDSWMKRGLNVSQTSSICNQFAASGFISKQIGTILSLEKGFFTPNGIDKELFHPTPLPALDEIRFMWVGNPKESHHGNNKAFYSIIKPIAEELNLNLSLATPELPVARDKMGEFYANNHVLLCMSEFEGGPLPIIEALASGRPVVTSNVGVVPEVVKDGENGYIISRSRTALRKCILQILDRPAVLTGLSHAAPPFVNNRYSKNMAESYDSMFEFVSKGVL